MADKASVPFAELMLPKTGGTEFRKPFDTEATMRGGETDAHGRYWTDIEQGRIASANCNLRAIRPALDMRELSQNSQKITT